MTKRIRYKKGEGILSVYGVYCSEEVSSELAVGAGPDELMRIGRLGPEHRGKIVFTGALLTRDLLIKGKVTGVAGFLCGGAHWEDLGRFRLPVCLIEGWGRLTVGADVWAVVSEFAGKTVRLEGPRLEKAGTIKPGARLRIVGDPGPVGLQGEALTEAGEEEFFPGAAMATVEVKTAAGKRRVPLNNVELIYT
jgi:hypothetical protein